MIGQWPESPEHGVGKNFAHIQFQRAQLKEAHYKYQWLGFCDFPLWPIVAHISHCESEWIAKANTLTFIKQAYLFSGLWENSSWVLSQPYWVVIEREWLVHLARPILYPFCQSHRRVFGSHWQYLFLLIDSFMAGKRKCFWVARACSAELWGCAHNSKTILLKYWAWLNWF